MSYRKPKPDLTPDPPTYEVLVSFTARIGGALLRYMAGDLVRNDDPALRSPYSRHLIRTGYSTAERIAALTDIERRKEAANPIVAESLGRFAKKSGRPRFALGNSILPSHRR